ncbi:glycosyltransferase [Niveibacterium umoris]|uniref:Glycosyltransferase involved in cell wall biosynthesis n=1 Tax=Niveibacterium umoris TaxID=1193620 RepID=A0A840BNN7_9RHOO|nr:glycosyltransferase family 4 protein [Niveibacterium umoris]MBB4012077.1 glycosyltransferase involved in cell wall biosynthesis [Niveibacterium umoris]
MRILFVHQNFPGQFVHLAPALAAAGHEVVALGMRGKPVQLPGVRVISHRVPAPPEALWKLLSRTERDWQAKVIRGKATADVVRQLAAQGFVPDLVFGHSGWGETLFIKDVLPACKLAVYGEYYYSAFGRDARFDPEFASKDPDAALRIRLKNTHLLHALEAADAVVSPTAFQRDSHPEVFRPKIDVIHDGIDTPRFRPDPKAVVHLRGAGVSLKAGDEVVTFVARSLEPYRGYHVFMRALPRLLRERPQARVVIVGAEGVSYGAPGPDNGSWKNTFLDEVRNQIDPSRVHFVGRLPHELLTQLMQVSAAHVYLTYPFVLSWSLLEAMSVGCTIVGSRTAPVEEVIRHGENGLLVDFFDAEALAATVADVLANRAAYRGLGAAARQSVVERYDLRSVCLPAQLDFIRRLAA